MDILRSKTLLFAVLAIVMTLPQTGQATDEIGIFTTSDGATVNTLSTTNPFEEISVYVMILDPSLDGVSGWEAHIEVIGDHVAPSWEYAGGGLNVPAPPSFNVGIGQGAYAVRAPDTSAALIATFTCFVQTPANEIFMVVSPYPGSATFPDDSGPGYVDPDDVNVVQALTIRDTPAFIINEGPPAATTITTCNATQTGIVLEWEASAAPDFSTFYLYRSETMGFDPSTHSPLITTTGTTYNDRDTVPGSSYYYVVGTVDEHGSISYSAEATADAMVANDPTNPTPAAPRYELALLPNSPNPFNPQTEISFTLAEPGHVRVQVHDLAGRLVKTLADRSMDRGTQSMTWEGRDDSGMRVPSGVYFLRLQTGEDVRTMKMTLAK